MTATIASKTERLKALDLSGCRFPLWAHEERPTMEFCGARQRPGSPYCEEHHALCRYRPKRWREVVE